MKPEKAKKEFEFQATPEQVAEVKEYARQEDVLMRMVFGQPVSEEERKEIKLVYPELE